MTDTEHKTMDEIRSDVLDRVKLLASARTSMQEASANLRSAELSINAAWKGWLPSYSSEKPRIANALHAIVDATAEGELKDDLYSCISQLAKLVARDVIAPIAHKSFEPVAWLTSNSYMPPLREVDEAGTVWDLDYDGELWPLFVESLEAELMHQYILMESPEYDNSLYIVDLKRWELIEDREDASPDDSINDDWQPINQGDN